jgi:hypothetical protein
MTRSAVTTEKTLRKQEKRRQRRRVNADLREQYSGRPPPRPSEFPLPEQPLPRY